MKAATIGRIVHYNLSESDAEAIEDQRTGDSSNHGNPVKEGETYPAFVVRTSGDTPGSAVNLKVLLDGNDEIWVTSRTEDPSEDEKAPPSPGTWRWPRLT